MKKYLYCLFSPGCVQSAETRQPSRSTLPRTFSHQILPAGSSSTQPTKGTNRPQMNQTVSMFYTVMILSHSFSMPLKVIMDEQTLDVLVKYTVGALRVCSAWTHSDILLALSATVYGNGPQCHQVAPCMCLVNCLVCVVNSLLHTHIKVFLSS